MIRAVVKFFDKGLPLDVREVHAALLALTDLAVDFLKLLLQSVFVAGIRCGQQQSCLAHDGSHKVELKLHITRAWSHGDQISALLNSPFKRSAKRRTTAAYTVSCIPLLWSVY